MIPKSILLLAAAGLGAFAFAPAVHAGDHEGGMVRLVGGCPAISGRADCPNAHPQNAHPGQCFAQVRTPPVYDTYGERVLVAPGRHEQRYVPAEYEWREKQVMVRPARTVRHWIAATYRDVTETVIVQAPSVHVEQIPPVFDTVTEQVVTRPAHTEWRRTFVGPDGVIPPGARVQPTGEVMCLVEVAAEYATVTRQVVRVPARTIQTPIPAVTREVERQVIDQPGHYDDEQIPAEYVTQKFKVLVRPGHAERVDIPPAYQTHTRQRLTAPGALEWRQVDCSVKDAGLQPPPPPMAAPPPPPPPAMAPPPPGDIPRPPSSIH